MAGQQHLTLLKTKGEDIIDATAYLKQFAKINVPKVSFSDIRLSCIGSFDGESYYDEIVIPLWYVFRSFDYLYFTWVFWVLENFEIAKFLAWEPLKKD